MEIRTITVAALLAACGSGASQAPIENRPGAQRPAKPAPLASCRAAVQKHVESAHREYTNAQGNRVVETESDTCGMYFEMIHFKFDSAQFEAAAVDELAGMLSCLDQTEHLRLRLQVIGHAGSDEHDPQTLALRRAEGVEQYLRACNVPVLGLEPAIMDPEEPIERSRRVDLGILERQSPEGD